jgi:ectoine hydroxylase-related dioxygenase (phytanoyl-CoA dioxygenase family)
MSLLETSLKSFGVTRSLLSAEQSDELDRNGFVAMERALDEATLRKVAGRVDELVATEGAQAGTEFRQEEGTDRLANLVDKGPVFDNCWNYPLQLAAVAHVLSWREFKLTSLNTRSALPSQGRQALHTDWAEAVAPGDYQICNSVWMLDDFTEENGATRAVPGSHRFGRLPKDAMDDPAAPHPDEV